MKVLGCKFYLKHDDQDYVIDQEFGQLIVFKVGPDRGWMTLHYEKDYKTILTPNLAVAALMKALSLEAVSTACYSVNDGIPGEV